MNSEITLLSTVDAVLKDAPEQRHSYFQLKHFVVNKEPTHQAKLWQCLRELQSRKESIESINMEIEENIDRLALIDIQEEKHRLKKEKMVSSGDKQIADIIAREWEIKLRQYARSKTVCKKTINKLREKSNFLIQELVFFLEYYKKLSEIEPVKKYDDLEAQTEYWDEKLSQETTLRTLLCLPLDTELAKTILSLSDEIPIKNRLIASLKYVSEKMSNIPIKSLKEENVQEKTV